MASIGKLQLKLTSLAVITATSALIGVAIMLRTNPKTIGPSGVTMWFINLLILLVCVATLVLYVVKLRFFNGREHTNRSLNSSFRSAFLIGVGAVTFLALKTLHTLSIKDIVFLSLVLLIIEFYLRTRKPQYEQ